MKNNINKDISSISNLNNLVKLSMIVSLLCIIGPITIPIPISPVPISLIQLVIYLSIYLLNYKLATYSTCLYLLMGFIGLPVFSGYTGGFHKIISPTGGYLLGFILMTFIIGLFVYKFSNNLFLTFSGYILGNTICYIVGTIWLMNFTQTNFFNCILMGVIPYLLGDLLKIIIALVFFPKLIKHIKKIS